MASFLMVNYRDPKNKNNKNFANSVVDIAASSRNWIWLGWLASLGLEVGKIIPFPVWIIPFHVLKINFETLGTNEKHFVK